MRLQTRQAGTVMWDHDGVLSHFSANMYPWLCKQEGWTPKDGYDWMGWHFYRDHGMVDADFVKRLNEYADAGGFAEQIVADGAVEAVARLKAAGFSQHVVTDRPKGAEADTAWWMDEFLPDIDTLTFGRDKTVFKEYGPAPYFALDDRVENVQAMRDAGIEAFLLTQPWNRDSDLPRVTSLIGFAELVIRSTWNVQPDHNG